MASDSEPGGVTIVRLVTFPRLLSLRFQQSTLPFQGREF